MDVKNFITKEQYDVLSGLKFNFSVKSNNFYFELKNTLKFLENFKYKCDVYLNYLMTTKDKKIKKFNAEKEFTVNEFTYYNYLLNNNNFTLISKTLKKHFKELQLVNIENKNLLNDLLIYTENNLENFIDNNYLLSDSILTTKEVKSIEDGTE